MGIMASHYVQERDESCTTTSMGPQGTQKASKKCSFLSLIPTNFWVLQARQCANTHDNHVGQVPLDWLVDEETVPERWRNYSQSENRYLLSYDASKVCWPLNLMLFTISLVFLKPDRVPGHFPRYLHVPENLFQFLLLISIIYTNSQL